MKKIYFFTVILAIVLASACSKTEVNPEVAVSSTLATPADLLLVTTTLAGANEVPAVTSTATGTVAGTYNKTTKLLNLNVTYAGITPTAWHIHKAAVGVAGSVVFNFGTTFTTPYNYISPLALATDQEADLLAGNNYFNMHSAKSASGEIRGQLTAAASTAKGSVTGKYNNTTKILTLTVTYSGLTPTAWHLHKGAAGVAGPVVLDLGTTFTSPFIFTTTALTTDQETDLKTGNYYLNIHSAAATGGEIRGQLAVL